MMLYLVAESLWSQDVVHVGVDVVSMCYMNGSEGLCLSEAVYLHAQNLGLHGAKVWCLRDTIWVLKTHGHVILCVRVPRICYPR